jgi:hypothetical protein
MTGLTKILTTIFILHTTLGLACDCSPTKDHDKLIESSFNYYQEIWIGKVVNKNNEIWIEVQAVFKGTLETGEILKAGFEGHSCAFYFGQEGLGLFYGLVIEKEFFADLCSPSRMFDYPHLYPPPPPPIPGSNYDSEREKQKMDEYERIEKKRLHYEIGELRKRKTNANNK